MKNRIYLIGYMGSGKTTIGKLLASKLGYSFIDLDKYIEKKNDKTIPQIFASVGESGFREEERSCLKEVSEQNNIVISTGGGAPCFFDNMDFMLQKGTTVYLDFSPNELASRLDTTKENNRPLIEGLHGDELIAFISEGLLKRLPFYQKAAIKSSGSIDFIIQEIISHTKTL